MRFCVQHEYLPSFASRHAYTRDSDDWLRTTPHTNSGCTSAYNWNFSPRSIDIAFDSLPPSVTPSSASRKSSQSVRNSGSFGCALFLVLAICASESRPPLRGGAFWFSSSFLRREKPPRSGGRLSH